MTDKLEDRIARLPPRMRMVIEYAGADATGKWIAQEMGVSISTVKAAKWIAFNRLGARTILEIVLRRQEERMETSRYVVIGSYEDGTTTIIVSREIVAPSVELAESLFKMVLESEGMGTPTIETTYGPYAAQA